LIKVKLLGYLADHIGMKMDAVVTGVQDFGIFAQGLDLPAEGLISIHSLTDDFYTYEQVSHSLIGKRENNRYRLGDHLVVEVKKIDIERRELDFRVIEHAARPGQVAANRKRPTHAKKPSKAGGKKQGRGKRRR
jgi:ribonuclease R